MLRSAAVMFGRIIAFRIIIIHKGFNLIPKRSLEKQSRNSFNQRKPEV